MFVKELICYEVARCPEAGANLQGNKKILSRILLHAFCPHFLRIHRITSSGEALKVWEHDFFLKMEVENSVTFNLPVQLRFIQANFPFGKFAEATTRGVLWKTPVPEFRACKFIK